MSAAGEALAWAQGPSEGPPLQPVGAPVLDAEGFAEINATDIVVVHHLFRRTAHQDRAIMKDVGAIDDFQGLAHIVVGDPARRGRGP